MQLIQTAIKRPIFISMLTLFMTTIGIISIRKLPVDLYPDISFPTIAVRVNFAGAAPEEVEQLVTQKLEEALSTISGVKLLRSISREAQSIVVLEFESGEDVRFQEIQVRSKISNIRNSLPKTTDEPIIYRQDPDDIPIIEIAVTGPHPASVLTKIAEEEIARRLRQISGVGSVELSGSLNREIRVELNKNALSAWRISADEVVNAIHEYNRNDPIGRTESKLRSWLIRSVSQIKSTFDLEKIPVSFDSRREPIFLKDIADIKDDFEDKRSISLIGNQTNLESAILIDIFKQSGENSLTVSNRLREFLLDIQSNLPDDIQVKITRDNSDLIRINIKDVFESIFLGAILTVLVVLVFLRSPRSTITTGLAIPNSVITTFAGMALFGFSINTMTLLALSLAIGLLVDDAIVVRENIFRHLQNQSMRATEAAELGTREVILSVAATTLTIVAVFVPVAFMDGVTGQFFSQFALTVVFAVLVSTWDAVTMAPMLSAYFANIADPDQEWASFGKIGSFLGFFLKKIEQFFDRLTLNYANFLEWTLKRSWLAVSLALGSGLITVICFFAVPKSFLPSQLGDTFQISLNGPLGVALDQIKSFGESASTKLTEINELEYWTIKIGYSFNGSANIRFNIKVKADFAKSQNQLSSIRKQVRQAISLYPGYSTRISEPSDPLSGSGSGRFSPVAVQIAGNDITKIRELAKEAQNRMVLVDGIADISPIDDLGLPEFRVYSNLITSAQFDVTPKEINNTLNLWLDGDVTNSLRLGDEQVPIRVRLANASSLDPNQLFSENILKRGVNGNEISMPITNFLSWEAKEGPPTIIRENRQRIMRVSANLQPGAALGDVVSRLQTQLDKLPLPSGYSMKIIGQNEQMTELANNVIFAIIVGSFFVYMVIASLFESFLHPFTVLAAIPLAATGAILALLVTSSPLDLYGGIGMILLAGIVAKNSILLVDFALQLMRKDNVDPIQAILETAPMRLRPILMTSIAMIAGMLPIATGMGVGGASRQSLGIATIGGVLSSTVLTLCIVPNLFVALSKLKKTKIHP